MLFAASMTFMAAAQEKQEVKVQKMEINVTADDYRIISDEVRDGVRYVSAARDGVILKVVYTRGCEGNAKGIGALIKDMTVEEAIRRLDGITCGKRGTSCPDQLARVLKAIQDR